MRKPKDKKNDQVIQSHLLNRSYKLSKSFHTFFHFKSIMDLDFSHLYLNYTLEGAERALKEQQRGKSAKNRQKQKKKIQN